MLLGTPQMVYVVMHYRGEEILMPVMLRGLPHETTPPLGSASEA